MIRKYHPDGKKSTNNDRIKAVNAAYRVVSEYLNSYMFSFDKNSVYKYNPDELISRKYKNDWNWGK